MNRGLLILVVILSATPSLAFHGIESFDRTATTGGGSGSYYTGSPRFKGYDCKICHVKAEERIRIELDTDLSSGTYEPGLIYSIGVKLVGEHLGLESAFNPNTFTADIVDAQGRSVGTLAASSSSIVEVVESGTVAVAEGFGNGETEWVFSWIAPNDPVPATLYIALLDGDGAGDPVTRFIDPINDDVATGNLPLCPTGASCEQPRPAVEETSPAGCSITRRVGSPWWFLGVLLAILWAARSRDVLGGRSALRPARPRLEP